MLAAVATATTLAQGAGGRIHVIATQPMTSPGGAPDDLAQLFTREIRPLAQGSSARIDVLPCICRQLLDVAQLLPVTATVIIAGPSRRWWPTREQRLAHDLQRLGHRVMFIPLSPDSAAASEV